MAGRFLMWLLTSFVGAMLFSTYFGLKGAAILAIILLIAFVPIIFLRFSLKPTVIACLISAFLGMGLFASTEVSAQRIETSIIDQECIVSGTVVGEGKKLC